VGKTKRHLSVSQSFLNIWVKMRLDGAVVLRGIPKGRGGVQKVGNESAD